MIAVPTTLVPWPDRAHKCRAAIVSSFGFSGTNAQVSVVGGPLTEPAGKEAVPQHTEHILTLSAKSAASLSQLAARHRDFLLSKERVSVSAYCATSNLGRAHFDHRFAVVASTRAGLLEGLVLPDPLEAQPDSRQLAMAFSSLSAAHRSAMAAHDKALSAAYTDTMQRIEASVPDLNEASTRAELQTLAFHLAFHRWVSVLEVATAFVTGAGSGALAAGVVAKVLPLQTAVACITHNQCKVHDHALQQYDSIDGPADAPQWVAWENGELVSASDWKQYWFGRARTQDTVATLDVTLRDRCLVLLVGGARPLEISTSAIRTIDLESPHSVLASLYVRGFSLNWERMHETCSHRKAELPTYQFDRKRFWANQHQTHPFRGRSETQSNATVSIFELDAKTVKYLSNHRVRDVAVVPATCYMEMVAPAVEEVYGDV
eukprot:990758-Rhodomonas_salina.2